jgi:hypothetical protein
MHQLKKSINTGHNSTPVLKVEAEVLHTPQPDGGLSVPLFVAQ